jgi:hypothetical protein
METGFLPEYQATSLARAIASSFCSFSLLAQRKRTKKKRPPVTCPAVGGMPCAPQCCREFANSLRSNSANSFFGSLSGARLRDNGGQGKY